MEIGYGVDETSIELGQTRVQLASPSTRGVVDRLPNRETDVRDALKNRRRVLCLAIVIINSNKYYFGQLGRLIGTS